MKACAKCRAELPDAAQHCPYCGTAQAKAIKSTVMGHPGIGKDLPGVPMPPLGDGFDPALPPTQLALTAEEQAELDAMTRGKVPSQGPAIANPKAQPPAQAPPVTPSSSVLAAQVAPISSPGQAQGQGAPFVPSAQPYGGGGSAPPSSGLPGGLAAVSFGNAQFGADAKNPGPGKIGGPAYQEVLTQQVKPLPAPGRRGEVEAWRESLTTMMLVFGVLLVACFVAPWAIGKDATTFSWTLLSAEGVSNKEKLLPIALAGSGIFSILLGAIPLGTKGRSIAAFLLGVVPIAILIAVAPKFEWRNTLGQLASISLVVGLILSRRLEGAMPKLVSTVGALALLAVYLIPENGQIPLMGLIDTFMEAPGKMKLIVLVGSIGFVGLLPLALTALSLLVWLPRGLGVVGAVIGWSVIFWSLISSLTLLVIGGDLLAVLKLSLAIRIYIPLAVAAWLALCCYGLAGVVSAGSEE